MHSDYSFNRRKFRVHDTIYIVCQTSLLLYYNGSAFFPDLCLYKCIELSMHGPIYVECSNMLTAVVLWTRLFPRFIPL